MVDVSYQMVLSTLQTVGLLVGIYYYVMTLRNQQKNQEISLRNQELTLKAQEQATETRQTQLFMNIYDTFSSKEYQRDRERMLYIWEYDDYDDFFNKYGVDVNPEDHAIWDMFCSHFEGIAVLVKRGFIDSKLVYDLMYGSIIGFWTRFEPVLLGIRREAGNPKVWADLEFLYNEMTRIRAEEAKLYPQSKYSFTSQSRIPDES